MNPRAMKMIGMMVLFFQNTIVTSQRIVLLPLALVLSCQCPHQKIEERFRRNRDLFEQAVRHIRMHPSSTQRANGRLSLTEVRQLDSLIDELNLREINTSYSRCPGMPQITFETDWTGCHSYLIKDDCDSVQAKIGYVGHPTNMVEIYGLGEGWQLLIDRDFY